MDNKPTATIVILNVQGILLSAIPVSPEKPHFDTLHINFPLIIGPVNTANP